MSIGGLLLTGKFLLSLLKLGNCLEKRCWNNGCSQNLQWTRVYQIISFNKIALYVRSHFRRILLVLFHWWWSYNTCIFTKQLACALIFVSCTSRNGTILWCIDVSQYITFQYAYQYFKLSINALILYIDVLIYINE